MADDAGLKEMLRVVRHMRRATVRVEPLVGGRLLLVREDGERLAADGAAFRSLARQGIGARAGREGRAKLTEEAGPWWKRNNAAAKPEGERAGPGSGRARASVNPAESPVALLARLRARDGKPWLGEAQAAAAERLRRDFERACLQPSVTMNWRFGEAAGGQGGLPGAKADISDLALAARGRVHAALDAVGPELSGLLLDVCCFLKGLELVESERQWPARSAKLMLRTGLDMLARHYGTVAGQAAGRSRCWGMEGFRPEAGNWGADQAAAAETAS